MNIAIISTGIQPQPAVNGGAVETLVDTLVEYNEKNKLCNLTVFSVYDKAAQQASEKQKHTKYFYFKRAKWIELLYEKRLFPTRLMVSFFAKQVAKQLKEMQRFDVVVVQNEYVSGKHIKKSIGSTPMLLHLHNDYIYAGEKNIEEKISCFNSFITISDYLKNRIHGVSPRYRVTTIHNGINLNHFSPEKISSSAVEELRAKIGFTQSDKVIVFAGRLIAEKGIKELIEAFNSLPEKSNAKLMIIGSSFFKESKTTPYIEELKSLAKGNNNIVFTGYVPYDKMPLYYMAANIGCVPSVWEEPFGLTVVEQMSMGLPVVVSDAGAIPEIVSNEYPCVAKRGESYIQQLEKWIVALCENKTLYTQVKADVIQRAQIFSAEAFAKKWFYECERAVSE